jgi:hypothetical protein
MLSHAFATVKVQDQQRVSGELCLASSSQMPTANNTLVA